MKSPVCDVPCCLAEAPDRAKVFQASRPALPESEGFPTFGRVAGHPGSLWQLCTIIHVFPRNGPVPFAIEAIRRETEAGPLGFP
ncbi:hypothetical protein RSP03_26680 [Cereibacter sphaeroides]|jgi:hypothetical protein|nr:hypothetical protein RSP03_26680 [Cereibacter sphaeroides]